MKKLISFVLTVFLLAGILPVTVVNAANVPSWDIQLNNGINADAEVITEPGTNNGVMRLTCRDEQAANRFMKVFQTIPVEYGKTYVYGYRIKGTDVGIAYGSIDWEPRRYLTTLSNTFDWTYYEYLYSPPDKSKKTVEMMFNIDSKTTELLVDDVYMYEYDGAKVGENLVRDGNFSTGDAKVSNSSSAIVEGGVAERIATMKKSTYFVEGYAEEIYSGLKYAPVYPAKNITIDGDLSDWEGYSEIKIPAMNDQVQMYNNVEVDVNANFSYAWDEDNFYVAIKATDDIHKGNIGGDYWREDSVQISMAGFGETLTEIGLSTDMDGKSGVNCSTLTSDQLTGIKLDTSYNDGVHIYEVAIPWTTKFTSRPDSFLFNAVINDNDGNSRDYCVQIAPGISEGKFTTQNPVLQLVEEDRDFDIWIEGPREITQKVQGEYSLFILNRGDKKKFAIDIPIQGIQKEITLDKNQGYREALSLSFDEVKLTPIGVNVTVDNKKYEIPFEINVLLNIETFNSAYFKDMYAKGKELDKLLAECTKKNISTDYETISVTIFNRYVAQMEKECTEGYSQRIEYYHNSLNEIYARTKEKLSAYLAGEKTPFVAPKYVATDDMEISGKQMIATADVNGEYERRPMYFMGAVTFWMDSIEAQKWNSYGFNAHQPEFGVNQVIKKPGTVTAWKVERYNAFECDIVTEKNEKNTGDYSIKVISNTDEAPNTFATLVQDVTLKPNTTYYFGFSAKGDKIPAGCWYSLDGWNTQYMFGPTADWQDYSGVYTSGDVAETKTLRIVFQNKGEAYLDDIYIKEGSMDAPNLLRNGDGETVLVEEGVYAIDYSELEEMLDELQDCVDNNIWVGFLLSSHYFPEYLFEVYPDLQQPYGSPGGNRFELTHPGSRRALSRWYEIIVPELEAYPCVTNFILANEPTYSSTYSDYNLPMWHEYLKNLYGDISKLNEAYGSRYESFEEVGWPMNPETRKPLDDKTVRTYDWVVFNNGILTEWHEFVASEVRKYTDKPLSTKAQNPFGESDWRDPRNMAYHTGIDAEGLLDVSDIAGNDAWWTHAYPKENESIQQKFFYYDFQSSYKDAPIYNSEDHIQGDGEDRFEPWFAEKIYTDMIQGTIHGRTASTSWIWNTDYLPNSPGDMRNQLGLRPDCQEKIGFANHDVNRLGYEFAAFQNAEPDVAVMYSNISRIYNEAHMAHSYMAYENMLFSGEKVEIITDSTIDKIHNYKVAVIPEVTHTNDEAIKELKKYVDNGGKLIIMGGKNSLANNRFGKPTNAEMLEYIKSKSVVIETESAGISMTSPSPAVLCEIFRGILKETRLYNIDVIEADTGKTVSNTEWQATEYNGKLLINICNYKFGYVPEIKIMVDGVQYGGVELISGEAFSETMTLNPYSPVILQIEKAN